MTAIVCTLALLLGAVLVRWLHTPDVPTEAPAYLDDVAYGQRIARPGHHGGAR